MKRTVFLVDMNAFFISCEMTRNPALRGLPAAVAGDPVKRTGIILAANYDARALGVRTAMTLHEALKYCPGLALVPPDHSFYAEKSREVMAILDQFSPVVEQNSIDEAWLDMTGCEGLFGPPLESARLIMQAIETKLGLWCSIGIAENKFLAKMASEMKKPRGITELWTADVPRKLWPLPVQSMHGVGGKTAAKLERLGIRTIGDLARLDSRFLVQLFGKAGDDLHRHANGIDESPVQSHRHDDAKSIGRSTTLAEDVSDLADAKRIILELAGEVGLRARRQGGKGQTVQITLKYTDFKVVTRQATVESTWSTDDIYLAGCALLEQNWDPRRPVRLLGITLTGFSKGDSVQDNAEQAGLPRQLSIFDMPETLPPGDKPEGRPVGQPGQGQASQGKDGLSQVPAASSGQQSATRRDQLEKAMDGILAKHGSGMITRAALIREDKAFPDKKHKPKPD